MKPLRMVVWFAISAIICGCGFDHDEQITGNYRLVAVDVMDQMSVGLSVKGGNAIGRINATVFAVGWDQRYIVAKQHPNNNRAVTNYYYLEMAKDSQHADPSASVTGPLTETEFKQRQVNLKLPDFTRTFKELQ